MSSSLLRLNETTLIFYPPQQKDGDELHAPHVVQVTMKMDLADDVRVPKVEDVACYCDAQVDITAAIQTILLHNILQPLPKRIEMDGTGYVLVGEKKEWSYGRDLSLRWGEDRIEPSRDKWTFYFRRVL